MATVSNYGYATDINVQSALPIEMNYSLPASLPSAKNTEIRIQPVNSQTFLPGSTIQIDIPCGRKNCFLDPTTSYIRFKATYTSTAAGQANAADISRLIGSGHSYFIKSEIYGNNAVLLESINEYGVLASMLINSTMTDSEKKGMSSAFGFESNGPYVSTQTAASVTASGLLSQNLASGSSATVGHLINYDTKLQNLIFEYSLPCLNLLGSGCDKMFPIGELFSLRLEYTLDQLANYTVLTAGTRALTGVSITEFEFVANIIELSPEAGALIDQQNPDKIHIRCQSYKQATNGLTATSAGTQDMLVGIRVSSLKSIYCVPTPTASKPVEGKYGGVNPSLDVGTSFLLGGLQYPQRGLSCTSHNSDTFLELQKSFGALSYHQHSGCITKNAYNASDLSYGGLQPLYNQDVTKCITSPNQFYLGVDVEVVARKQSLLSGLNINSSPMFLRAVIGTGLSVPYTFNYWGYYDVILEIDKHTKNIIAKF